MALIYNREDRKQYRRELRKRMPLAEVILWSHLKNKQLNNQKFRRQYSIDKYIIDFYCPEKRLAIEIDGDSHYLDKTSQDKDRERDQSLASMNIKVLRFINSDIYNNLESVLGKISTSPVPPCKGGENREKRGNI